MNFQNIPPVESSKSYLDLAFKRAREKAALDKNRIRDQLQRARTKETQKIDIIKENLCNRLQKILATFPETLKLPKFYQELIKLTLDFPLFKKSFGALVWADGKVKIFSKLYVSKIIKCRDPVKIKQYSREYYGRISSVFKQISMNLDYLEHSRKVMKNYPDIKEMFTVCLYGFPNVGKTTLLNKLTGTKAKTAAYSFTTISINAGYFTLEEEKIQVLDVPGTLNREEKMNEIELQAELVLEELADLIIYVFDITENCGYGLKKQEELYQKIKEHKNVIFLSKKDLLEDKKINEFKHKHYSIEEIKEMIAKLSVKK